MKMEGPPGAAKQGAPSWEGTGAEGVAGLCIQAGRTGGVGGPAGP